MNGNMSVSRGDWQTYLCDECGDEVIIPTPPFEGILGGVCCTCRDVRHALQNDPEGVKGKYQCISCEMFFDTLHEDEHGESCPHCYGLFVEGALDDPYTNKDEELKRLREQLDSLRKFCHKEDYDIYNWEVRNIEGIE
mgnify:CR=1 FL=1